MPDDVLILTDKDDFEYFCRDCKQFRLSLDPKLESCGNCGSTDLVIGAPGSLDKDEELEKLC